MSKVGLSPGALVYTGTLQGPTTVERVAYSAGDITFQTADEIVVGRALDNTVNWWLVCGLSDTDQLDYIGVHSFGMSKLLLEDVLNVKGQRPHAGTYQGGTCFVLAYTDDKYVRHQISFWIKGASIVSFEESSTDFFYPVFDRLRNSKSETRLHGPTRLLCILVDFVVDQYFTVAEKLHSDLTTLEEHIVQSDDPANHIREIYAIKKKANILVRDLFALREVAYGLVESAYIQLEPQDKDYAEDIAQHVSQLWDYFNAYSQNASSLIDMSVALNSDKMNGVMKFLTVLSTIFLPLSFLCAWYGTNFIIPETKWENGYLYMIALSLGITLIFLVWFRRKKWL